MFLSKRIVIQVLLILSLAIALPVAAFADAAPNSSAIKGTISGGVTDRSGKPIPNAAVVALDSHGQTVAQDTTKPDGNYRLNVTPGTYTIEAIYETEGSNSSVTVGSDQTKNANFSLNTLLISGVVAISGSNGPLPSGTKVRLIDENTGFMYNEASVSPDGAFAVPINEGSYTVAAYSSRDESYYGSVSGLTTDSLKSPLTINLNPAGKVSGTIQSASGLKTKFKVKALNQQGKILNETRADENGHYTLAVPTGRITIVVAAENEKGTQASAEATIVPGSTTLNLTVMNSGLKVSLANAPTNSISRIRVFDLLGNAYAPDVEPSSPTDTYAFLLPPGIYIVKASAGAYAGISQPVTLAAGKNESVAITLENAGTLSGKVSYPNSRPKTSFEDISITVQDKNGQVVDKLAPLQDGSYETLLPAGNYRVATAAGDSVAVKENLSILEGQTSTYDPTINPTEIAGMVTEPDGTTIRYATIVALSQDGSSYSYTTSKEDGTYSLKVPPGSYTLKTMHYHKVALNKNVSVSRGSSVAINPVLGAAGIFNGYISNGKTNTGGASAIVLDQAQTPVDRIATHADTGFFSLMLPAGQYTVDSKSFDGNQTPTAITVAAEQTLHQNLTTQAGKIGGTIFAADGKTPLGGVIVRASNEAYSNYTKTNGDGTFALFVPAGIYTLKAEKSNMGGITKNVAVSKEKDAFIQASLQTNGVVTGRIMNESNPAAQAWVKVYDSADSRLLEKIQTGQGGGFSVTLPAGTYVFRAESSGFVSAETRVTAIANKIVVSDMTLYSSSDNSSDSGTPNSGQGTAGSAGGSQPTSKPNAAEVVLDPSKDGIVVKESNGLGQTVTKITLDKDKLAAALQTAGSVIVQIDRADEMTKVELPAESFQNPDKVQAGAMITLRTDVMEYKLPVHVLRTWTQSLTTMQNIKITVAIEKLPTSLNEKIIKTNQLTGTLLPNPMDFKITAEGSNGLSQELVNFGAVYVERKIIIPGTIPNKDHVAAVTIDPVTHEATFIPSYIEKGEKAFTVKIFSTHNSIYTVATANHTFDDIAGHWAESDIQQLASKFIVKGMTDKLYEPDTKITRAEFTSLLVRSLGLLEDPSYVTFNDIQPKDWYAGSVGAAVKAGLVNGFENGTFEPNGSITREQMAVMINRALKAVGSDSSTKDADMRIDKYKDRGAISEWSAASVEQAVRIGIIEGMTDMTFEPSLDSTRAQVATVLKRFLQYVKFTN
ncbi:carboxypeptidase regulatory-like domain-containing protein [Paenibacillus elgii]|uniref:carboxypeptidase regulatory-like domain-containing protein n=1 Tax=Paenibacillus elgii TaxID=189691 RepID=UPI00203B6A62|nr:carboxypeptidase regulatory-like domain-containing protein [Paenibacillus elgii]MCM3274119.1 carboxypeptidase regulatory-like domain-containing protein [Paenibacillus elgii]